MPQRSGIEAFLRNRRRPANLTGGSTETDGGSPQTSRRVLVEFTLVVTGGLVLILAFALAGDDLFTWIDRWAVRPLPAAPRPAIPAPPVFTAVNLGDGKSAPWIGKWVLSSRGTLKPRSESIVIRPIANGIQMTIDGVGNTGARVQQDYTAEYVRSAYVSTVYKVGSTTTRVRLRVQDGNAKGREFSVESDGKTVTLIPPQHWRDTHYVALPADQIFPAAWTWRATYDKP